MKSLRIFFTAAIGFLIISSFTNHPVYVSVTTIEHNAKDNTLEITCKMFTDDLENALKKNTNTKLDLYKKSDKAKADGLIQAYVSKHLLLAVNTVPVRLEYIGYEIEEESTLCYFQVNNIPGFKKCEVTSTLLYETQKEQMGIIHAIKSEKRKSYKLQNPDMNAVFNF